MKCTCVRVVTFDLCAVAFDFMCDTMLIYILLKPRENTAGVLCPLPTTNEAAKSPLPTYLFEGARSIR